MSFCNVCGTIKNHNNIKFKFLTILRFIHEINTIYMIF
jgi:hypothetical protein